MPIIEQCLAYNLLGIAKSLGNILYSQILFMITLNSGYKSKKCLSWKTQQVQKK